MEEKTTMQSDFDTRKAVWDEFDALIAKFEEEAAGDNRKLALQLLRNEHPVTEMSHAFAAASVAVQLLMVKWIATQVPDLEDPKLKLGRKLDLRRVRMGADLFRAAQAAWLKYRDGRRSANATKVYDRTLDDATCEHPELPRRLRRFVRISTPFTPVPQSVMKEFDRKPNQSDRRRAN
jgi:hypothetical protein